MNEVLFLGHMLLIILFVLLALREGREALFALVVLLSVCSNLFVLKRVALFGLDVTCSDVFSVGCILGVNLINEYYGKDCASRAVMVSFGALVMFGALSQVHIMYIPSATDVFGAHYSRLLSPAPRILIASLTAYLVSGKFDVAFFSFLRRVFNNRYLPMRTFIACFATQLLDTTLFSFLGLYGVVSSVAQIIGFSFFIKLISISFMSPILSRKKHVRDTTYIKQV